MLQTVNKHIVHMFLICCNTRCCYAPKTPREVHHGSPAVWFWAHLSQLNYELSPCVCLTYWFPTFPRNPSGIPERVLRLVSVRSSLMDVTLSQCPWARQSSPPCLIHRKCQIQITSFHLCCPSVFRFTSCPASDRNCVHVLLALSSSQM